MGGVARGLHFLFSQRFNPKDQEVHIQAARTNEAARSRAFATLSLADSRFSLIGEALRDAFSASAPASRSDFHPVMLQETADAFQMQMSGVLILLASAKVHTGAQHALSYHILFGESFR